MGERGVGSTTSLYKGPDAYSTQRDAWDQGLRSQPRADEWFVSTADSPIWWGGGSNSGTPVADTWYLIPLSPLARDFTVAQMRMRITTLVGGGHIDAAIFTFQHDTDGPHLRVIPQLYMEFDATSTGVKTKNVTEGPEGSLPTLRVEHRYWLGYNANSTVTRFLSLDMGAAPVIGARTIAYSHSSSHHLHLDKTVESTSDHFPYIVFLSKKAAEIF